MSVRVAPNLVGPGGSTRVLGELGQSGLGEAHLIERRPSRPFGLPCHAATESPWSTVGSQNRGPGLSRRRPAGPASCDPSTRRILRRATGTPGNLLRRLNHLLDRRGGGGTVDSRRIVRL